MSEFKFDIGKNSESLSISAEIYTRILLKAIAQTMEDIKSFEAALPVDDWATVQSISHKLKGDYDNLRLTELATLAKEINDLAKEQTGKERIAELWGQFMDIFNQLKTAMAGEGS